MIFYYTGTGTGKYIAENISKVLHDEIKPLVAYTRDKETLNIKEDESIVIVTPVYFWGLPTSVLEFSKLLSNKKCAYKALVLECGGSTGNASKLFEKNAKVDAVYALLGIDNYCPMYKVSSGDDPGVSKRLDIVEMKSQEIAKNIIDKKKGDFNTLKGGMAGVITPIMYSLYKGIGRNTKFKVSGDCIGCGQCAKDCNVRAIEMKDGKPIWVKSKCDMCLMCLSRCPKEAISIGKSKGNGRFVNPRVKF